MSRRDVHRHITDTLIAAIETGPGKFVLPWRTTQHMLPVNSLTNNHYNGINILALWVAASQAGYASPLWATYRQWEQLGAHVSAGERATLIVFYKSYTNDEEEAGDEGTRRRFLARASMVFNVDQVVGYARKPDTPVLGPIERLETAEKFVADTGANIAYGGGEAFYSPSRDHIQLPADEAFIDGPTMDRREAFYATLLHELVHWSGAKHRLNRDLSDRFGSKSYAAEELVAELGAAFLCSELGISQDVHLDHAQYLASWLELLKSDSRAIFTAAARASDAVQYLRQVSTATKSD